MQAPSIYLGIEIGGTKLQLARSHPEGGIGHILRYTIDPLGGAQAIRQQIMQAWNGLEQKGEIAAIGIGFGGPVDWQRGTIRLSHQVAGWDDFNLSRWLQQITGKPVAIENDANVAAMGEALNGCGYGYDRVFYMTIGSGIGGGLVINGSIYHGRNPGEVEIGHLRLNKQGDTLESTCSGWAVNKKVKDCIQRHPGSLLSFLAQQHTGPEAALLHPALEKGEPVAQSIISEVADDIALALSHVVHLIHPDIIIIGGGLSLLQEHLRQPVAQQLPRYLMSAFLPPPPVYIASLGADVVPIGAIELAKKSVAKIQNDLLVV